MTKNILILALITIIILLLLRSCGDGGKAGIIRSDTVYVEVKADTFYVPKPYKVEVDKIKYKPVPVYTDKWDTLYLPELIGMTAEDTLAILADYYATYYYSDTIRHQYGKVTINDTITQNKMSGRGVITDFKIPVITNTIIEKRNEFYIGGGLLGNIKDPLQGYEVNLLLKNKKDNQFGAGYQQIFDAGNYFKINYYKKLSFRKNQ